MKKADFRTDFPTTFPTTEQLYALERAARRERARVVAQLFASGVRALKALFARAVSVLSSKVARHA